MDTSLECIEKKLTKLDEILESKEALINSLIAENRRLKSTSSAASPGEHVLTHDDEDKAIVARFVH